MPQIEVINLSKHFHVSEHSPGLKGSLKGFLKYKRSKVTALDEVSFSIEKGELVGYIGPNGAGKSTTVKILSGILVPDEGECLVEGRVPWKERVRHVGKIGVVFGQRTQLWWDLPVAESFALLKEIYRIPDEIFRQNRKTLVELLDLDPLLSIPVRQLSLGQRMRCDIAAALLHQPSILFLDEPTIGLDAVAKLAVRDIIHKINREKGVTVILTTHDMDDIEALCSRVMVIGQGRILSDGTLTDLRDRVNRERRLIIDLVDGDSTINEPGVRLIRKEGHRIYLGYDPEAVPTEKLISRIASSCKIRDLYVENTPIEEIIAQLYRDMEYRR